MHECLALLANFVQPEQIGTSVWRVAWIIPLIVSIAVVYKSTKVYRIVPKQFAREAAGLFGSILVFIALAALVLLAISWLMNDVLAG